MRKASSIILLFAFILAQYSRHISYLQCITGNSNAANCNCVKVFSSFEETNEATNKEPLHRHLHLEENYRGSSNISETVPAFSLTAIHFIAEHYPLADGVEAEKEHPPQST